LIYVETNGVSLNWFGFSMPLDTDTPAGYSGNPLPTYTAANEVTVAHALYDVVDGIFTRDGTEGVDDDALDLPNMEGDRLIWDVLLAIKENETLALLTKEITMETFVDIWIDTGLYVPEFLQILQAHSIEYFEDIYEQDDDFTQAAIKQTDGTVYHHTYYPAGDPDWSVFTGNVGVEYVIKTSELFDGADTILELYDTDGTTLLDSNNDREPSEKYSLIAFAPPATGQYYVKSYRQSETPMPIGEYGKYNLTIYIMDNPEILSIIPNTGPVPGGTVVNITGNNFTAGATVLFGVYRATNVIVYDVNTINATSPANVPGPANVTILNPPNSDNVIPSGTAVDGFTYTGAALPPILHKIAPDFGSTNAPTNVTVEGDYIQSAATLYFNAIECASYTVLDPKTIRATVQPLPQDLYDVNVTNPDGQYDLLEHGFESTVQGYNITDVVFPSWTTFTSTLEIQEDFIISDLYVYLNLSNPNDNTHQYSITLKSPTGTIVRVYERIEVANPEGGWRTHIDSTFGYDEPPSEVLWLFKGESTKGNWTLNITVRYGEPNTLYSWGIIFFKYRHRDITRMVYVLPEWRNYVLALDEDTGEFLYRARLEGYPGWPMSLAVSSDLRYIYASTWTEYNDTHADWVDSHVSMFEAGTGRRLKDVQLYGHMHIGALEPVPQSDRMVAVTYKGVHVFNTTTHAQVGNVPYPEKYRPRLGVTPDGKKVYVTNKSSENIDVIDLETFTSLGQIPTPGFVPNDVDVAFNGTFAAVVGENSTQEQVLIINTTTDTIVDQIDAPYWGTNIELTPDDTKVFYTIYQWYAGVGVLNLTTGIGEVLQIQPQMTSDSLAISEDYKVYTPDYDAAHNDLIIWNATDNSFLRKIHLEDASNPNGVDFGDGVGKVMSLSAAGGDGNVTLSWVEPDSPGTPISSYRIYRGASSWREVFLTEISPATTFIDSSVINGQTYYYRVSAVNGRGEGPLSEEASAFPTNFPPDITNVMAIPNPQETGGNVNITATIIDNTAVGGVWVNISHPGGTYSNDTMIRIGVTDDYYRDVPYTTLGLYGFTIWTNDTDNNWNYSSGHTFLIQETTPPQISDLQDGPDPQETGSAVNISANVTDNFSVYDVWVNISYPGGGFSNVTMTRLAVTDTYFFENNYVDLGTYSYTIWANDTSDNWASASGSFDIIDSQVPMITNLVENPDPQETGGDVNITGDVTDNFSVLEVWINITHPGGGSSNASMTRLGLTDTYFYENNYIDLGSCSYAIWASDTSGNWASASGSFDIIDSQVPIISNLDENPDPQETGGNVNITADVFDNFSILDVWINMTDPVGGRTNVSMMRLGLTDTFYSEGNYFDLGTHAYTIWAGDISGNWASASGSFLIIDSQPPSITNLVENPDPQEIFGNVNVTVNITDNVGVAGVWINISGNGNHTMSQVPLTSQYYFEDTYSAIGAITYTIWARDTSGNWNSTSSTFAVQDTTQPIADAGDDKEVNVTSTITFDGSGSQDNSGAIANYTWVIMKDGSVVATLYGVSPTHTFNIAGNFAVTLEVADPSGNTGSDSITVIVKDEVEPPGDGTEGEDNILLWMLLVIILIIAIILILIFLLRRKKKDISDAELEDEESIIIEDSATGEVLDGTSQDSEIGQGPDRSWQEGER
jgi:YVTN family beta-propeller protein